MAGRGKIESPHGDAADMMREDPVDNAAIASGLPNLTRPARILPDPRGCRRAADHDRLHRQGRALSASSIGRWPTGSSCPARTFSAGGWTKCWARRIIAPASRCSPPHWPGNGNFSPPISTIRPADCLRSRPIMFRRRMPDGNVVGMILLVQDITEQRAAERALKESEARFRRIADSAPVMMWVTRLDRTRDFVNDAYAEFTGLSREEARVLDWRERIHPDDQDQLVAESIAGEASLKPFTPGSALPAARWGVALASLGLPAAVRDRWGIVGLHRCGE